MRVTAVGHVEFRGALVEFVLDWAGEPDPQGAPVSFNQGNHLRQHATPGSRPVWLAGSVELAGPALPDGDVAGVDIARVATVIGQVIAEQEALRLRFRCDPEPRQHLFSPDQLQVTPRHAGMVDTDDVVALLNSRCHPRASPGLCFALVGTTLLCGFDHAHADALTIDIVLRRIVALYHDPATPAPVVAGFVQRCISEDARPTMNESADRAAGFATWEQFFAETGGKVPRFPLPLGDVPAATGQATHVRTLLADEDAAHLDDGLFAALLSELAGAVADLGGPDRLATLIPLHTRGRRDSGWHATAGWLVTNAPVVVDGGDRPGARAAIRRAVDAAGIPLPDVLARCAPQLPAGDLFMVSFLDYRKLGPELRGGQHISACSTADDVQIWFSRTHRGLDVRVRYPATATATAAVVGLTDALARRLRQPVPVS